MGYGSLGYEATPPKIQRQECERDHTSALIRWIRRAHTEGNRVPLCLKLVRYTPRVYNLCPAPSVKEAKEAEELPKSKGSKGATLEQRIYPRGSQPIIR